jgi:hypothetical protein
MGRPEGTRPLKIALCEPRVGVAGGHSLLDLRRVARQRSDPFSITNPERPAGIAVETPMLPSGACQCRRARNQGYRPTFANTCRISWTSRRDARLTRFCARRRPLDQFGAGASVWHKYQRRSCATVWPDFVGTPLLLAVLPTEPAVRKKAQRADCAKCPVLKNLG